SPPGRRAGPCLCEHEAPALARAGHEPRGGARARGRDAGAPDVEPRPRGVLRGVHRQASSEMVGLVTTHRLVNPESLSPPVGFTHAVVAAPGRAIHVAGQAAQGPDGSIQGRTTAEQFDVAAGNLVAALAAVGALPEHLVSLLILVTDVAEYRASLIELGEIWRRHLGRHYPAVT